MKSEVISNNRFAGRPNTIRNLISGMNSNANNGGNSFHGHPQHQSVAQQTQVNEDESFVHKVNLAAAFHDHISCTKAGGNINSLMAFQMASDPYGRKSSNCDPGSFLFRSCSDEDKEQIKRLREMILTQLDLIQHQQEQLLKKDRQLQGLKHDREALCMRLEKMERRITFLTSKLVAVNSDSNGTEEADSLDPRDSENDSLDPFCNLMSDPSSVFSKIYSNSCPTQFLNNPSIINANSQTVGSDICQNAIVKKADSSMVGTPQQFNSVLSKETEERSPRKRSLGTREKLPMKKRNRASKSLDSENKISLVSVNNKGSLNNSEKAKSVGKKRRANEKHKKCDSSESANVLKNFSLKFNCFESDDPYEVATNREANSGADNVIDAFDESKEDLETIEVPSWRLHPISSCYSLEGTENLDDEVFNRRHSKLEIDERRRKRWDIQRLREQKQNEKLRSGRYYSGNYVNEKSESKKDTVEIQSFFPDPIDLQFIEVCDKLPVIAFGYPVPRIPKRDFALPWLKPVSKVKISPKSGNS